MNPAMDYYIRSVKVGLANRLDAVHRVFPTMRESVLYNTPKKIALKNSTSECTTKHRFPRRKAIVTHLSGTNQMAFQRALLLLFIRILNR